MRSKRNSSHIMLVHRDCPASENGAISLALNLGTRSMMSPHDCGGSTPTWSKIFLFQYRTIGVTVSIGTAYSLPSTVAAPNVDGEALVLQVRVLLEPAGQVDHLVGIDVALQATAAPAPDHRRALAGADRGLHLLLVGVVGEERDVDLGLRVGLVEARDRVLADRPPAACPRASSTTRRPCRHRTHLRHRSGWASRRRPRGPRPPARRARRVEGNCGGTCSSVPSFTSTTTAATTAARQCATRRHIGGRPLGESARPKYFSVRARSS